jgi:hypothetical protein
VGHVHTLIDTGYTDVVDADPTGYFDSIPYAELMQSWPALERQANRVSLGEPVSFTSCATGTLFGGRILAMVLA